MSLPKKASDAPKGGITGRRMGSVRGKTSGGATSSSGRRRNMVSRHVSWNDPSLMYMSACNGKGSYTLDKWLNKRCMRESPLVLEASKADLMP